MAQLVGVPPTRRESIAAPSILASIIVIIIERQDECVRLGGASFGEFGETCLTKQNEWAGQVRVRIVSERVPGSELRLFSDNSYG